MSLEKNAVAEFAAEIALFSPKNDDQSDVTIDNIIGGAGPFDFSGSEVTIATVPLITKIDSGAAETVQVDLSGAADPAAVTAAEVFAAINLAAPTDITASLEAVTSRLKLVYSGAGTPNFVQVYGQCAELGLIGQGLGYQIISNETFSSLTDTPDRKESETFTKTSVKGKDVEVKTDGFRKGTSGTITDPATDYFMRRLFEGGTIDATTGAYSVSTPDSKTIYFQIDVFWGLVGFGTNKEGDILSYTQQTIKSCSGAYAEVTRDRNIIDHNYTYIATPPIIDGVSTPDSIELPLTIEEFIALDLGNLSA